MQRSKIHGCSLDTRKGRWRLSIFPSAYVHERVRTIRPSDPPDPTLLTIKMSHDRLSNSNRCGSKILQLSSSSVCECFRDAMGHSSSPWTCPAVGRTSLFSATSERVNCTCTSCARRVSLTPDGGHVHANEHRDVAPGPFTITCYSPSLASVSPQKHKYEY
jgi:hypothetical protein